MASNVASSAFFKIPVLVLTVPTAVYTGFEFPPSFVSFTALLLCVKFKQPLPGNSWKCQGSLVGFRVQSFKLNLDICELFTLTVPSALFC